MEREHPGCAIDGLLREADAIGAMLDRATMLGAPGDADGDAGSHGDECSRKLTSLERSVDHLCKVAQDIKDGYYRFKPGYADM